MAGVICGRWAVGWDAREGERLPRQNCQKFRARATSAARELGHSSLPLQDASAGTKAHLQRSLCLHCTAQHSVSTRPQAHKLLRGERNMNLPCLACMQGAPRPSSARPPRISDDAGSPPPRPPPWPPRSTNKLDHDGKCAQQTSSPPAQSVWTSTVEHSMHPLDIEPPAETHIHAAHSHYAPPSRSSHRSMAPCRPWNCKGRPILALLRCRTAGRPSASVCDLIPRCSSHPPSLPSNPAPQTASCYRPSSSIVETSHLEYEAVSSCLLRRLPPQSHAARLERP